MKSNFGTLLVAALSLMALNARAASSTTTLVSSLNPSASGQSVTFTAVVSAVAPATGTPTGTVTFTDGAVTLGTMALSGGQAALSTASLSSGTHSITANYNADTTFNASASSPLTQVVNTTSFVSLSSVGANSPLPEGGTVTLSGNITDSAGSANGRFLSQLYLDLLQRPADTAGFNLFNGQLSGGTTRAQVAQTFTTSTEYRTVLVQGYYSRFLQRAADSSGLSVQLNLFASGYTDEQVIANLVGSAEYFATRASNDNATFLNVMYQDLLGRPIDAGAQALFLGQLTLGVSRTAVAQSVLTSAEYRQNLVSAFYTRFLRRAGSVAEVSAFVNTLAGGSTDESVIVSLVSSTEYYTLAGNSPYQLIVAWSDGTRQTNSLAAGAATFSVFRQFLDDDPTGTPSDTYTANVSLSGITGNASAMTSVTVTNVPPSFVSLTMDGTLTAGVAAALNGVFTDPGVLDTFTLVVDWGDGARQTNNLSAGSRAFNLSHTFAASGGYTVTATLTDDDTGTTTQTVNVTVLPSGQSSVSVTSSLNPTVFGATVALTAVVSPIPPATATPSGTVVFFDGATRLATLALDASGSAVLNTSPLALGAHLFSVSYGGDANFNGSISGVLSEIVNKSATLTTLTTSANPSVSGQSVTFNVTVTAVAPGAGTPSGTVTFLDGAGSLATVSLNGSGQATLTTSALAVGTHPITVTYSGDANFNASATLAALNQIVNRSATATVLISNLNPSAFGQGVTFTATVSVVAPGAGTPSGTVTFFDGAAPIGTAVVGVSGQAATTQASLGIGAHTITAQYSGDAGFASSTSLAVNQSVNKAGISISLASIPASVLFGQSVTCVVTVNSLIPGVGIPTGTITFRLGTNVLGTATLDRQGGATLTKSVMLAPADYAYNISYDGDVTFQSGSSAGGLLTVQQAATSTTVTSSLNPSPFGQGVTFTATASAVAPGAGTPMGTMTFYDGSTPLGVVPLDASGRADFTMSLLAIGTHSVTAQYSGDLNFSGSTSAALSQTVNKAVSISVIASSVNPSVFGQSVTVTATVGGPAQGLDTPTGTVTFYDGAISLASVPLNGLGIASFTATALTVGNHDLMVKYNGDTTFDVSTTAVLTQTVNKAATLTALTSSANPSVSGQSVTFNATIIVAAPGAGTPTGTVTFFAGATPLGTVSLDAAGRAAFTTATAAVGAVSMTAVYSGDGNFLGGTSGSVLQSVNRAGSAATVASSANPAVFGQRVVITATVSASAPGTGTPTGMVTFMDGVVALGAATLNASGQVTLTNGALAVGTHNITVGYGGDVNFNFSTSAALPQIVNKSGTTTALDSSVNPASAGQSVMLRATVNAAAPGAGAPTGTVTFTEGATVLGTAILMSGQAALFTTALGAGAHSITANYNGDASFNGSTSITLTQTVNAAPSFVSLNGVSAGGPVPEGGTVMLTGNILDVAGGANGHFLTQLYLDLLQRPPDTGGFNGFNTQLAGGASRTVVAQEFVSSAEYRTLLVQGYFSRFLQRPADPAGLNAQLSFLVSGGTDEQVIAALAGSAEYFQTRATNDNANFLNALYQDLLGRPVDTAAQSFYLTQLAGGFARSSVALLVLTSAEYRHNLITGFYQRLLHRTPAAGEVNSFTSAMDSGTTDEDIVVALVSSAEYYALSSSPYQLIVDWGDGTRQTNSLAASATTFSVSRQFLDDNPTGTPSDTYTVNVSLSGVTGSASATTSLTITNVPPSFVSLAMPGPVVAGTASSLVGVFADPGVLDTFTLIVDWGDGLRQTNNLGAGVTSFNLSHTFASSGNYTVSATLTDDDTGTTTQTVNITALPSGQSSVTLNSSQNPAFTGASVTFTASVSAVPPATGVPTGTVAFYNGANFLGSSALAAGTAAFNTSSLPTGTNVITAIYGGDANFNGSTSAPLSQVIQVEPVPQLAVRVVVGLIEISWPDPSTGFILEVRDRFDASLNWTAHTGVQTVLNGRRQVLVAPLGVAHQFFRLRKPGTGGQQ